MRVEKKWIRNLAVLAVFAAIVCAQAATGCQATKGPARNMPPDFLHTESEAWNQWLDSKTVSDVFSDRAEREILSGNRTFRDFLRDLAGPADLKTEPSPALDRRAVHVVDGVLGLTVRQALWKVCSEQGITVALAVTPEPCSFLDVPETEIHRDGPNGSTTMSMVKHGDPQEYQSLKAEKKIYREEVRGDTLYYAVREERDMPFPNGGSAWFIEVQRYKIPAPKTP